MPQRTKREPLTPRGEATRDRLVAAAESLFGRSGFHATSVADITREAGVGHGTFYLYFQNKEAIFRDLIRYLSRELRRTIREAVEGLDHRVAVEERGMAAFLEFVQAHRDLYRIVLEAEFVAPEMHRWYYERLAEGYAAGLAAAMEAGEVAETDPETLGYALMGMAHFMGVRWVVWEGREPPPEARRALMEIVRRALGASDVVAGE